MLFVIYLVHCLGNNITVLKFHLHIFSNVQTHTHTLSISLTRTHTNTHSISLSQTLHFHLEKLKLLGHKSPFHYFSFAFHFLIFRCKKAIFVTSNELTYLSLSECHILFPYNCWYYFRFGSSINGSFGAGRGSRIGGVICGLPVRLTVHYFFLINSPICAWHCYLC